MKTLEQCIHSDKEIIIFGAGSLGFSVYRYVTLNNRKVSMIVDNDQKKWGHRHHGIKICPVQDGKRQYPDAVYLVANASFGDAMKKQLMEEEGVPEGHIILCGNEGAIRQEILKRVPVKNEDKNFIYDSPWEISIKNTIQRLRSKAKSFGYTFFMDHYYPQLKRQKKYQVSICVIFKDEAPYLKEWLVYHKIIGVQHFYMYNNFSQDGFRMVLQPFIDAGDVTLMDWPYEQGQILAYRDCVEKFRNESQWIGFIDIDEFIVPIDDDNLYGFLKKFEKNRGSVLLYWKFFGSSGKIERGRTGLVTEDFTVCWRKHANIGKCFYNTSYDFIPEYKKNSAIHHYMWTGYQGKALPPVNCFGNVCIDGIHTAKGDHFPIQINHYFTKSFMEYGDKKKKGDVFHKQNPHDDQYFLSHDKKCGAVDVAVYKYLILLKKAMMLY